MNPLEICCFYQYCLMENGFIMESDALRILNALIHIDKNNQFQLELIK